MERSNSSLTKRKLLTVTWPPTGYSPDSSRYYKEFPQTPSNQQEDKEVRPLNQYEERCHGVRHVASDTMLHLQEEHYNNKKQNEEPEEDENPKLRSSLRKNPGNLSIDLHQVETQYHQRMIEDTTMRNSTGSFDISSSSLPTCQTPRRSYNPRLLSSSIGLCTKLTEEIYVGGTKAAENRTLLKSYGITHIINCAKYLVPDYYPLDFIYYSIDLRDHLSQDITAHFYNIIGYIENIRYLNRNHSSFHYKILVHCVKGISRSPAIIIAYMLYKNITFSFEKVMRYLMCLRPIISLNAGFSFQIAEWERYRQHTYALTTWNHNLTIFRLEMIKSTEYSFSYPLQYASLKNMLPSYFQSNWKSSNQENYIQSRHLTFMMNIGPLFDMKKEMFTSKTMNQQCIYLFMLRKETREILYFLWYGEEVIEETMKKAKEYVEYLIQLEKNEMIQSKILMMKIGEEEIKEWNEILQCI